MKKHFLIISIFFFSSQLHAQIIKSDNQPIGINKFILGESKSKYNVITTKGGKYTKDNHEFTIYAYADPAPVEIEGIRFTTTLMTFDDSDRLVSFASLKFYRKKDTPKYDKRAKADYEKIVDFVIGQLSRKGESKIYYKTSKITDKGKEWNSEKVSLKVKKTYTIYNSTIEISFSQPGH